jgi:hypothetical protein
MYESHLAKVDKRARAAREAIEETLFDEVDGLRDWWVLSTPAEPTA